SWAVGRRLLLQKGQPALTGFRRRAMPPQAECRASACGACAGNRWGSSGGWSETTKNPSKRVCARLWVPARDVIVHDFVIDLLMSPDHLQPIEVAGQQDRAPSRSRVV